MTHAPGTRHLTGLTGARAIPLQRKHIPYNANTPLQRKHPQGPEQALRMFRIY